MGIFDEIDLATIAVDKTTILEIKATIAIPLLSSLTTNRAMTGKSERKKKRNPFAPGDFAEKRVLKLVERFSGHCGAIKS